VSPPAGAPQFGVERGSGGVIGRHATEAWQRALIEALEQVGDLATVSVTDIGATFIAASLTASQHRALIEAAWLLQGRGVMHLSKTDGSDYRGGGARHLLAWTCAHCSPSGGDVHRAMRRCVWCNRLTDRRNRHDEPDCGRHRYRSPTTHPAASRFSARRWGQTK
jgi:hypothetical protein